MDLPDFFLPGDFVPKGKMLVQDHWSDAHK